MNQLKFPKFEFYLRLPHFEVKEGGLCFLKSPRPFVELTEIEARVFRLLRSPRSLAQIRKHAGRGASKVLAGLWDRGLIVGLPAPRTPPSARPIVVLEPHLDDAALSLGGWLFSKRKHPVRIVSVAGDYISTTLLEIGRHQELSVTEVSKLRSSESNIACKILGAKNRILGYPDAPLRFSKRPDRLHRLNAGAFSNHYERSISQNLLRDRVPEAMELAKRLAKTLGTKPMTLLAPMGIGSHPDHIWTRNSALAWWLGTRANSEIGLYEDLPYAGTTPDACLRLEREFQAMGYLTRIETMTLGSRASMKRNLLASYASQWKTPKISETLKLGPNSYERILWIKKSPNKKPMSDLDSTLLRLRSLEFDRLLGSPPLKWVEGLLPNRDFHVYLFHEEHLARALARHPFISRGGPRPIFHRVGNDSLKKPFTESHPDETAMMLSAESAAGTAPVLVVTTAYRLWERPSELGIPENRLIAARNLGDVLNLLTYCHGTGVNQL